MGGINNRGQVVGLSCINDALCDSSNPSFMARAYLWQNGKMIDLNSLVVGGAPLYLIFACHINDSGKSLDLVPHPPVTFTPLPLHRYLTRVVTMTALWLLNEA